MTFDPDRPYRLNPAVALRPERFGALAYHFGNRRLTFLKSTELVCVVRALADHPSARATLAAAELPERRWPAYERALARLASSEVIDAC